MSKDDNNDNNEQRIDKLTKEIARKRGKTNFGSTATLVIGLLAMGLLTAYFLYGYMEFQWVTQPENLVNYGKDEFDRNLVKVRAMAEEEIKKSAPDWAREISEEVVNNMPTAREQIEETLKSMLDEQLEEGQKITAAKFQQIVQDNRKDFAEAIESMTSEGGSEEFAEKVVPILEREVSVDMRYSAVQALGIFSDVNSRLEKLATGEGLNEIEQQMRYVLGLVKRLQAEQEQTSGS